MIAQLARKVARRVVEESTAKGGANGNGAQARGSSSRKGAAISIEDVTKHLGPPRFLTEERQGSDEVGTVNGLAWTPYGGEVLHVEATTMAGK